MTFAGPRPRKAKPLRLEKVDPKRPRRPLATEQERDADLERAAAKLAGHSILVVEEMAKELKAGPRTVAGMLANMADAHERCARRLGREALRRRLIAEGGKP
jgi:hypothetical protein